MLTGQQPLLRLIVFSSKEVATMLPLLVLTLCVGAVSSATDRDPMLDQHWELWKNRYNKIYNETEEGWKRMVWEKNLKKIELHNLEHSMGKHTYTLGMNQFGDMTNEEFGQIMNGYKPQTAGKLKKSLFMKPDFLEVPSAVDWRERGYVTPVKNQVIAGSLWLLLGFQCHWSSGGPTVQEDWYTGVTEPAEPGGLFQTPRQYGLWRGWMDWAFQYVMSNQGLDSEASYPYVGTDQICQYNPYYNSANVTGIVDIFRGSEQALMEAVAAVGPVSVAIDAGHVSFQFYESGIYYEPFCSSSQLNHGVLAVGYGFQKSLSSVDNYWIVKNSWGTSWGNNGYIYMAKDKDNNCGIATVASYPLV